VGSQQLTLPSDIVSSRNVRLIGPVSRSETDLYYRQCDLFLLPTFSDGFALTQLEAQLWKLPVIATPYCGEVVVNGWNGWILEEISGTSIAEILNRCIDAPQLLIELSSRSAASQRFSLAEVGHRYLSLFSDVG
jgi:glycosyltransferase involved in cell wall biosynthesis